ncbi:MAG: MATE family efflux transporter [Clostridia bacterium]|nr:MATE family efflux transporter [Clostridia bacterium]
MYKIKREAPEQLLTVGKPYKKIVRFTLPILAGSLFQQLYNMADAFIVSRILGVDAFAGVSSTGGLTFLILGFAQGMTAGLSIAMAQSFGAQDYQSVKKHYLHNLVISLLTGVLLTIIALVCNRHLLMLLRTPDELFEYAYAYLQIIFAGILASMLFNFYANALRALGDSRSPLNYLLIASALNIVLDIILILWTPLGVRGAALATVLSQGTSAMLCMRKIARSVSILSLKDYKDGWDFRTAFHNLRYGLPMAFQSSIIALGVIVMQFATNNMGAVAVASYAVAAKIDGIAVEPLRSLGMTMTTFTAQNYGAGKLNRILTGVKQSIWISAGMSVALGLLMYFGGWWLSAMFIGTSKPVVLEQAHMFLIIHGVLYIILALLFIFRFSLQGLGYAAIPTVAGVMELVMRVVAAFFLVPRYEFVGASFATPLSWLGALIPVMAAYYLSAKNKLSITKKETL